MRALEFENADAEEIAMLRSPVALFLYNRAECTIRTFERIRAAKPTRLFVVGDAPRPEVEGDAERCARARAVADQVDWDCRVETNWATTHLGAGLRIATGIDWIFAKCEQAILLEDDCLPDSTFFRFCDELLERYRTDSRVMMISGDNYQGGRQRGPASYYFSSSVGTHGWATWRRAWEHFDFALSAWPSLLRQSSLLLDVWKRPEAAEFWGRIFDETWAGRHDAWDYQWALAMWSQRGLQISPNQNLVTNIGSGPDATHTRSSDLPFMGLSTVPMRFPLQHPQHVVRDLEADLWELETIFGVTPRPS